MKSLVGSDAVSLGRSRGVSSAAVVQEQRSEREFQAIFSKLEGFSKLDRKQFRDLGEGKETESIQDLV